MVYDDILDGVLETEGLGKANQLSFSNEKISKKQKKQIEYIQSLKPIARDLWSSYRQNNPDTDYSTKEIQNCYLLRYFLPYSNLLKQELDKLNKNQNINVFGNKNKINNLTVSFFGCGPAPEIIGLLGHLNSCRCLSIENLEANLFDINSSTWKHSINLIKKFAIPGLFKNHKNLKIKSHQSDFSSSRFFTQLKTTKKNIINKSNLVVFQNCLNEVNDDIKKDQLIKNIGQIILMLPKNSILIFIDQSIGKYQDSSGYILEWVQSKAKEKKIDLKVLHPYQNDRFNCRALNKEMPELIDNSLFYTGYNISPEANQLILRNAIDYSSLIIERQ